MPNFFRELFNGWKRIVTGSSLDLNMPIHFQEKERCFLVLKSITKKGRKEMVFVLQLVYGAKKNNHMVIQLFVWNKEKFTLKFYGLNLFFSSWKWSYGFSSCILNNILLSSIMVFGVWWNLFIQICKMNIRSPFHFLSYGKID